jgi:hypothetical protein
MASYWTCPFNGVGKCVAIFSIPFCGQRHNRETTKGENGIAGLISFQ